MSVNDLINRRNKIDELNKAVAFALVGNSVWRRVEELSIVALFDTEEAALAYEAASRLPSSAKTLTNYKTIYRMYRPDSLLWDFNGPQGMEKRAGYAYDDPARMVYEVKPLSDILGKPNNPAPPSGDVPPFEAIS